MVEFFIVGEARLVRFRKCGKNLNVMKVPGGTSIK